MGSANVRWLFKELPGLVAAGVLDPSAAEHLRTHYAPQAGSRRRWVVIGLGVFGAALIGAGITMLLAHNWAALSRPARVAVALGLLFGAQAIAGFALWRRPRSVAWREGSATGWVFATGAALGLITQTYHIAVEPGDFIALWTLLVLPIVWLLRSRVATALAWCGAAPATMIGVRSIALDDTALFWGFALLMLPVMLWLGRQLRDDRLAALPFWSAAVWLPIAGIAQTESLSGNAWMLYFPALFAGMHAVGLLAETQELSAWRRPLWLVGGAGTGAVMLALSFVDVWGESRALHSGEHPVAWIATAVVIAGAMLLAAWQAVAAMRAGAWTTGVLLSAPILVGLLYAGVTTFLPVAAAATICSAWMLAVGLLALIEGARQGHIGMANAGMAFLAALAAARFFDADVSLLARGIGFVAVGLSFLSMNAWLLRQARTAAGREPKREVRT